MLLVVGLGNPGPEYVDTRHNAGFMVVEALREYLRFPRFEQGELAAVTGGRYRGRDVELQLPLTFMNRSGTAVDRAVSTHGIEPGAMLVVVDDVYLPLGRLRFRRSGGDGGHNGLKSIIGALGSSDFPRLRIGVGGGDARTDDLVEFVLGAFTAAEHEQMASVKEDAAQAVTVFLTEGIEAAMSRFNSLPVSDATSETGENVNPKGGN